MSNEQFGFLDDRQFLDAIGISQEVLYSIHHKYMEAIMMNMDLVKACDHAN